MILCQVGEDLVVYTTCGCHNNNYISKISFILQTLYNSIYMYFTTTCIGVLSKNKGLILRVAAVLHVAFCLETPGSIPEELSLPSI